MSTRSTTKFGDGPPLDEGGYLANVYRHHDGYPEEMLPCLGDFFLQVESETEDTRFGDPNYLAAKWVVFLARIFSRKYVWGTGNEHSHDDSKTGSLDFRSVGVVSEDPGDIEYSYYLDCRDLQSGRPAVYMNKLDGNGWARVDDIRLDPDNEQRAPFEAVRS